MPAQARIAVVMFALVLTAAALRIALGPWPASAQGGASSLALARLGAPGALAAEPVEMAASDQR